VTTFGRLRDVLNTVSAASSADGYQVKAICVPHAMPPLAPLIIGRRDVLIGFDDPRYYGVSGAIHIVSEDAVILATKQFETMWSDPRCVAIKSPIDLDRRAVQEIRRRLRKIR
jgi:hypothetical protein